MTSPTIKQKRLHLIPSPFFSQIFTLLIFADLSGADQSEGNADLFNIANGVFVILFHIYLARLQRC